MHRHLGDEVVLLNVKTGTYFGLSGTGVRFWELLCEGASFDRVIATVGQEFEVDEATLRNDLGGLLEELLENRLVEVAVGR